MSDFRVDLDEISFNLRHVADLDGLAELEAFEHVEADVVDQVLAVAARFAEEVIAPLNRVGDTEGARRLDDGSVATPTGFREAYRSYVEAGWGALSIDPEYGGGGFPHLVGLAVEEMFTSACMSWSLCPLLTQGAINMLSAHGTDEQKALYLPRMASGDWTGTMNLTEPQAGSDLGAVAARALPQPDGSYRLHGTKIFITYGEHDLADNIVHLVLARTPGAPPGTRGISCFLVPKHLPAAGGSPGARNDLLCVSIEHKLGIHASPTCVMSYGDGEGALGFLVGEENGGMRAMFTMMNHARLSVGLEGVAIAERSYQQALAHAHERRQGRAPGAPAGEPSAIIDHPDVRRMLLDMRSSISAMRGLAYRNAEAIDRASHESDASQRQSAVEQAALLTPLSKAWATNVGCELVSVGLQVHGGMGFIEETGSAQHYRDARIAPIYEGTNGIQAADLVGRKLSTRDGGVVRDHLAQIRTTAEALDGCGDLAPVQPHLEAAVEAAGTATEFLLEAGPVARLAGADAFLRMLAVTTGAAALADGALAAARLGDPDAAADRAVLARFFAANRLSAVPGLIAAVVEPADDLAAARQRILAQRPSG
ncbi:MAG: acyl-CoA dehydrogenase [Acidimicrobiaceae bacterium]|nr:acyl-CoA dehydrogenase [Acidimicrobiaceae bacterium]MYI53908.1 acyl-CoA dehydrogenase [Acidimicrobiaceae bacterium]